MVLTMVYNTQGYYVSELCPPSGILNKIFWKLDLFSSSGERVGDSYSVESIKKSQPQSLDNLCQYNYSQIYI
jgi:hypothetical protein